MAFYVKILDQAQINEGDVVDLADSLDLGSYCKLEVVVRVDQAGEVGGGDAPILIVEHSASNEEGTFLSFTTPVEVDLTTTGSNWFHQEAFTRWIAWRMFGSLSVAAVVTLEIVAKP